MKAGPCRIRPDGTLTCADMRTVEPTERMQHTLLTFTAGFSFANGAFQQGRSSQAFDRGPMRFRFAMAGHE